MKINLKAFRIQKGTDIPKPYMNEIEKPVIKFFQNNADYYKMISEHHLQYEDGINIEEDVIELIRKNANGFVLDAGCGEGSISAYIAQLKNNIKIFGIDVSPIGIKLGKDLKEKRNIDNLIFFTGDIKRLPFKDAMFNLILCQSALEHVVGVSDVVKEFHRTIKKEGKLVIRVGNEESFFHFSFVDWIFGGKKERYKRPSLILRPNNRSDIRENFDTCIIPPYTLIYQLRKSGFDVEYFTTFPKHLLTRKLKNNLLIRQLLITVLFSLRKFKPICYIGPTTIILAKRVR